MKLYTFYFKDGRTEVLEGSDYESALLDRGYGMDYILNSMVICMYGEDESYKWINGKWVRVVWG